MWLTAVALLLLVTMAGCNRDGPEFNASVGPETQEDTNNRSNLPNRTIDQTFMTHKSDDALKKHKHPTANFEVTVPDSWAQNLESEFFQFVAPNDAASLTISAYGADGGTFDEFVEYRWSTVEEFYNDARDPTSWQAPPMHIREFQGVWPGEQQPTYYIVACAHVGATFLSLGIVTTQSYRTDNKDVMDDILKSITVAN